MPDYFCLECGGRTSLMGHMVSFADAPKPRANCDQYLLYIIDRLCEIYPTMPRERAVEAVGRWQIGELRLPPHDDQVHLTHCNTGEYRGLCKYGDTDCPALLEIDEAR